MNPRECQCSFVYFRATGFIPKIWFLTIVNTRRDLGFVLQVSSERIIDAEPVLPARKFWSYQYVIKGVVI